MTPPPSLQDLIDTVRHDTGTDDPISQLATAAQTASDLEESADALLGHFVDRCRKAGYSWSQISAALGVTKQAVHKRFAAVADQVIAAVPAPTLERFTMRARTVLAAAVQVADAIPEQAGVSSEHILIGLFAEPEGIAAKALTSLHVTLASLPWPEQAIQPVTPDTPASIADLRGNLAAEGEQVLHDTLAVALSLGHNYIGTEHLLLALYRNPASRAARILAAAGATEDAARARVSEFLSGFTRP